MGPGCPQSTKLGRGDTFSDHGLVPAPCLPVQSPPDVARLLWEGWREPWAVPRTQQASFRDLPCQRLGQAKLGKPCSTQGPAAQPGSEAQALTDPWRGNQGLVQPQELFVCRTLPHTWRLGLAAGEALRGHLVVFAQQSHGLLLYLILPPLLSIVFLVQLDFPAATSPT